MTKTISNFQARRELCISIWARWNAQLKGLVELERRCRNTRQEVQVLSERQEIFQSTVEDKLKLQSRATERYHDQIIEETKELEGKKSVEAMLLVQKMHDPWRYQNERDEARRLQSSRNSRRVRKELDLQHPTSPESCRSSTVDHDEEMTLESLRKRQEVQEVMKETEWKEARGREEEALEAGARRETEMSETGVVADGVEGIRGPKW